MADDVVEDGASTTADAGRGAAGENAGEVVVGRDEAGGEPGPVGPLVAVGVDAGPVAVDDGAGCGAGVLDRGADPLGDRRAQPVSADHHTGIDGEPTAGVIATLHAGDPAVAVAADVGDGDAVADVGTGGDGGIDEHGVEQGAPGA